MSRPVLTTRDSNILSPTKSNSRSNSTSPLKGSPTKRTKLSGNNNRSPFRRHVKSSSTSTLYSASSSASVSASPTKTNSKLNFTIFQDPILNTSNKFNDLEIEGQENDSLNQEVKKFNEQENILQPKYKVLKQSSKFRTPLSNLSIKEFPGFMEVENSSTPLQLNEPFIPKNFKNESNSIHKFYTNYPSYISPMKSNNKFLFKSVESNEFNEDDALEQDLFKKSLLMKRKRSLSLGKNDLKLNLIKKNDFTILSN